MASTRAFLSSSCDYGDDERLGLEDWLTVAQSSPSYSNVCSTLAQSAPPVYRATTGRTPQPATTPAPQRKVGMLKELLGDLRGYIRDNRDLIFSIAFVLVLDEFVFKGAFRERLKAVIEGVLKKVENKTGIDIPGV